MFGDWGAEFPKFVADLTSLIFFFFSILSVAAKDQSAGPPPLDERALPVLEGTCFPAATHPGPDSQLLANTHAHLPSVSHTEEEVA